MFSLDSRNYLSAASLLIFLLFLIFFYSRNKTSGASFTNVMIWFLVLGVLVIVYAFRFELDSFKNRILSVLIPSYSWSNTAGQLMIARSADGHFYVDVLTDSNSKIRFLIDTGASDVALTEEAAILFGFNPKSLRYSQKYNTANGISYAAPVRIEKLRIGKKEFEDVAAHVTSGALDIPLLGMSLIGKFRDFKITNDTLILSY
ncbi:MAG: TIGR02281 family clan AA aspartic protease [Rickettsiales bacterium]|nr:TIGR02281 family clan AA aspartic protease [Rickettsiales bacterium]MCA0254479.1 TIGR02281 family clan AA aspartic protease [Pseudomonadota bacterium]